ncbi:MAG: hypothetical protein ACHQ6U_13875 [Thermodesulfobacteriota bacterium]
MATENLSETKKAALERENRLIEVRYFDPFKWRFVPRAFKISEISSITADLVDSIYPRDYVDYKSKVLLKNGDILLAENNLWDFMGTGIELVRGGVDGWSNNRRTHDIYKRYDEYKIIPIRILDRKTREFTEHRYKASWITEVITNHTENVHVPKYGNRKNQIFPRVMCQALTIGDKKNYSYLQNPIRDLEDTPITLVVEP